MIAETTGHTPSLAQVRQIYANSMDPAGFDRWLAEERRAAADMAYEQGRNDERHVKPELRNTNPYRAKETKS